MSRSQFLAATGASLMLVGALFTLLTGVVFPQILVDPTQSPTVHNLEQNVGVFAFCVGLTNVLGRGTTDPVGVRAILVGSLLSIVSSAGLDVYALVSSIFLPIGWGVIVYKSVVAGGYLWFLAKLR